jgi:acyl carrier protein
MQDVMNSNARRCALSLDNSCFLEMMSELLKLDGCRLDGTESLKTFEPWDSIAVLEYLALLDSRFDLRMSIEEIARCKTFNDLYSSLANRLEE